MKPGRPLQRSGAAMPAPLSSLLGAYAGGLAFAGSFGAHGALLFVALHTGTAPAAPAAPTLEERVVDVDVVSVAPPPLAPSPPPLAPPRPVATEPSVRVTQLRAPPAPLAPDVAPRATSTPDPPAPPVVQEAAAALTADEGMPHFTIAIGGGSAPVYGAVSAAGSGTSAATGTARLQAADAPVPEQGVSSPAHLAHGDKPPYPSGARAERVEGDVVLELVLSTSGTVESVRVLEGAGHGFDAAAAAAAQSYRFSPALKDGHPVRVRMRWTVQFRLH
jgi:protein TonB